MIKLCAVLATVLFALSAETRAVEPLEPKTKDKDKAGLEEYVNVDASSLPKSNTVATKLATPLRVTPAIVGTVAHELFTEQGAVTLSDVLENVAGLNIQPQSGVHDFFVLRGFDSLSGALVMVDGAPVPEATHYPTYNMHAVEVLKGPGGFLYGGDPLSGAVNIVRKQPVPNNFIGGNVSLGSFATATGSVDWNEANEDGSLAFRLNGFYRESDNFRDAKPSEHWGVNPGFTLRPSDRSTININAELLEANYSPDAGIPFVNGALPDVPRERSYQSILDFSEQDIQRLQVDYEYTLSERVTLRNKTYFRDLDWQTQGTLLGQAFFSTMTNRTLTSLDNGQRFVGNQFEALFRLGEGRVKHQLLAGVEVAQRDNDYDLQFGFLTPLDIFNPVDPDTSAILFPLQAGSSESTIVAPYVVDQIEFSPKFFLMLGLRYDDIGFDATDDISGVGTVVTSRSDGDVSPWTGFTYAPTPSLSLYVNAAQSFAPPSARVVGPRDPEESRQVELGVKKQFLGGKVQTTLAVYDLDRSNIAIPDNNGFTQQQGDQTSRGVEFELAAEPLRGLHTFFSYALSDAELTRFAEQVIVGVDPMTMQPIFMTFDRGGNDPAFAPRSLANLWVSKRLGRWGVGGGARYIDSQFIAADNSYEIDSSIVLDAAVSYRVAHLRFDVQLKNLTDEEYELRGFGSDSVIPADPFAVYAGVSFEY